LRQRHTLTRLRPRHGMVASRRLGSVGLGFRFAQNDKVLGRTPSRRRVWREQRQRFAVAR
jgi:hypothetical protein